MRTTLTLDDDVAMLLKRQVQETGASFRDVVNQALRRGLIAAPREAQGQLPQPRSMGGARVDLTQALALAEALDDAVLLEDLRGGHDRS